MCVVCLCVLLYLAYQIPDESADDEESLRDGATGGSGEDCLLLRLACVRVLLRAKREPDAAAAATLAAKIHPYSAAAQVLLRCAGRGEINVRCFNDRGKGRATKAVGLSVLF